LEKVNELLTYAVMLWSLIVAYIQLMLIDIKKMLIQGMYICSTGPYVHNLYGDTLYGMRSIT